jgi:tRNA-2-methylthio-N6-dimethylallyladenosine synthase
MRDHIVVFDGHDRMIGEQIEIDVTEASPFTLYGDVVMDGTPMSREGRTSAPAIARTKRIGLRTV